MKKMSNDVAIAYAYDFLSLLFENSEIKQELKEIILFGSVAKGVNDKKSDIDLFFNSKNKEKLEYLENEIKRAIKSFEIKSDKTWALKRVNFNISFIVGNLEEEKWKNLKDEIISSGLVLYSPYKESPQKLNQKYLIYYSLANLSRKAKMKIIRLLSGYTINKGKKEYKQKGLLEDKGGLKLGTNVIIIERDSLLSIKKIFSENNIKYKILETWIKK